MVNEEVKRITARARSVALGAGVVGLVISLGLALTRGGAAIEGYLLSYVFWMSITLGAFVILMIQHVTGGRWGISLRRILEAALRTLPLMALLIIPVLLSLKGLYPWADPEVMAHDVVLQKKAAYLDPQFFILRTIGYFVVWLLLAHFLYRGSGRLDVAPSPETEARLSRLSAPGIVIFVLTTTFAAFDWMMSLEPHWFSTIYGVYFGAGGALAALAFAVFIVARLAGVEPMSRIIKGDLSNDYGNLLLAFTMFWAYIAFSQFLIIWSGNLPEETPWFLNRFKGGWQYVGIALIVVHFFVPFLVLLLRGVRRSVQRLAKVALLLLIMRLVDTMWLVLPAFSPKDLRLHVMDIAAVIGIGGIWVWCFLDGLAKRPLLPVHDTRAKALLAEGDGHHG